MSARADGGRRLLLAAAVVMLGAVAAGLHVLGSPAHQRNLALDHQRQMDLSRLSVAIGFYSSQHGSLPANLAEATHSGNAMLPTDPVSGASYTYTIIDPAHYRLCATFAASSEPPEPGLFQYAVADWQHPAGLRCFELASEAPKSTSGR